ncbi:serine-rich coiled-coil domain-containing protein 2 [Sardina pilchardus]|uniref:serine-rich coiled-coil domain-containing protein 2 n=1 Tax=Sardina pilchardus TaxID=27697 RepID=UPI002E10052B
MDEQALRQPMLMVSRLPKFGSRPPGGAHQPVHNGSAIPSVPVGGKALAPPRQNGIVRPPPTLSYKWKEKVEPEESRGGAYRPQQQPRAPITVREIKRPTAPMAMPARQRPASSVPGPFYRAAHQPAPPSRRVPSYGLSNGLTAGTAHDGLSQSSDSLRLLPPDNMVRSQSFSHMTRAAASAGAPIPRSYSFNQELPRPSARLASSARSSLAMPSTTPILNGASRGGKAPGIARAYPVGHLLLAPANQKKPLLPAPAPSKPSALSYRLMRPSLIRQPRPTPIGRAQEEPVKEQKEGSQGVSAEEGLVAPHPNCPRKSSASPTAPPTELSALPAQPKAEEARADELRDEDVRAEEARIEDARDADQTELESLDEFRLDEMRVMDCREDESRPDSPTVLHPELDQPEADEPRAADLSIIKTRAIDPRADELSPDESNADDASARADGGDVQESSPDESADAGAERAGGLPELCVTSATGETLEDMSLSSTSSLERTNDDTSEEYIDDFDNLGNGGGVLLLPPAHDDGLVQSDPLSEDNTPASRQQDVCSVTSLHSFLSESVDWGEMGLTGGKEAFSVPGVGVSSDGVFRDGSSLDLSPSDSSGATYMWDDEDGLEPLGGAMIPCHSYDSDLNSMDILNNLDNLEPCDLEEDDLMLDVDLPEDASLHSEADGRSHWRKMQQQLWGRQELQHNNNNSREGVLETLGSLDVLEGLDVLEELDVLEVDHVSLDELTLQHMAQDCTSVKNQLLQLKQLLQVEEADCIDEGVASSDAFTPDLSEEVSCDQQVQELLIEVQKLRDELRNKDKMIAQLTQQMQSVPEEVEASRCSCPLKSEIQMGTRPLHQDGTTQTPWRGHAGLLPASLLPPWLCPKQAYPRARLPVLHRQTSDSTAFQSRLWPPFPSECTSGPPTHTDPQRSPGGGHHRHHRHHHRTSSQVPVLPSVQPQRPPIQRARDRRTPTPPAPPPPPAQREEREGSSGRPPQTGARSQRRRTQQRPPPQRISPAPGSPPPPQRVGLSSVSPGNSPPPARGLPSFSSAPQACLPAHVAPAPTPGMGSARSALVPPRGYRQVPVSPPSPARDLENGDPARTSDPWDCDQETPRECCSVTASVHNTRPPAGTNGDTRTNVNPFLANLC